MRSTYQSSPILCTKQLLCTIAEHSKSIVCLYSCIILVCWTLHQCICGNILMCCLIQFVWTRKLRIRREDAQYFCPVHACVYVDSHILDVPGLLSNVVFAKVCNISCVISCYLFLKFAWQHDVYLHTYNAISKPLFAVSVTSSGWLLMVLLQGNVYQQQVCCSSHWWQSWYESLFCSPPHQPVWHVYSVRRVQVVHTVVIYMLV